MTTTIVQNAFLPTQIPGCKLWLDAADTSSASMTLSGTTLTTWRDKSGNGLNMTAGGNYPTYTNAGIQFNGGVPNLLSNSTGYSATTALTTFVVYQSTVAATRQRVFRTNYAGNSVFALTDTTYVDLSTKTTYNYVGPLSYSTDTANITSLVPYSATSLAYAINGTQSFSWSFSTTATPFASIVMVLGGEATVYFTGFIMEVIMYDAYFTDTQRQQVEGYLAWKWGIQAKLPSTHLYKNTPAAIITQPTTLGVLNITNRINSASFLPTTIPGCQLWLDAADTSTITGTSPVTAWRDKSGKGNNPTTISGITYSANQQAGYGTINMGSGFITGSIASPIVNSILTCFLVVRCTQTTSDNGIHGALTLNQVSQTADFRILEERAANFRLLTRFPAIVGVTIGAVTSSYIIWTAVASSSSLSANINGSTINTVSISTNPYNANVYNIGTTSETGVTPLGWNGFIAEEIIYSGTLNNSQIQQVEGYLAWKWGLVASLPISHPYKTAPFSPFSAIVSVASLLNTNQLNSKMIANYFNPRTISGLQFWIDGADRTSITFASANRINGWNDKSGNGYNLSQSISAYQPTYFSNYINLGTVSNYYMNIPQAAVNNASSWSMFFVFNPIESANYIMVKQFNGINTFNVFSMTKHTNNGGGPTLGTTNIFYFRPLNSGPLFTGPSALSLNTVQLISFRFDGTNLFYYVNGNLGATTAGSFGIANQTGATNFTLGGWFTAPETPVDSVLTNFNLGELQFFNNAITTAQRQTVEGYLAWKWGIQGSLAPTHPYKLLPPPPN